MWLCVYIKHLYYCKDSDCVLIKSIKTLARYNIKYYNAVKTFVVFMVKSSLSLINIKNTQTKY